MIYDRFEPLGAKLPAGTPFDELRRLLARYADPGSVEGARLRARPFGTSEKVALAGDDLFALESAYTTKFEAECPFEAHRAYADLQCMVEGEEFLDVAETGSLVVETPYDPERDIEFFRRAEPLARLRLVAGRGALLLPDDAHRPGVATGTSPTPVRKVVFKIRRGMVEMKEEGLRTRGQYC